MDSLTFHDYRGDVLYGYPDKIISVSFNDGKSSYTDIIAFSDKKISITALLNIKKLDCKVLSVKEQDNKKHYRVTVDCTYTSLHA